MCQCETPNVNGEAGYSWDGKTVYTRPVDPPELEDGDCLIHDEPGRCGFVDSHSHHVRVVKRDASYYLLVRHGGGDERIRLSCHFRPDLVCNMDTDARYWLLMSIYRANYDGVSRGRESEAHRWRSAAAEKRIKTRKRRGQPLIDVWIE